MALNTRQDGDSDALAFDAHPPFTGVSSVARHIGVPLACTDLDGRHLWWNSAYSRLSERTTSDLGQVDARTAFGQPPQFAMNWERVQHGYPVEFVVTRADEGGDRQLLVRLNPFRDPDTGRQLVAVALEDHTAPRQALTDLQRYASLVAYSMDAILSIDAHGRIDTWNAGAQNLYGYTADEVLGKPLTVLAVDDDPEGLLASIPQRAFEAEVVEGEVQQRCRDGSTLWVSVQASPIFHRERGIDGASIIARDVTDRHTMEDELRGAKDRAEQAAIAKSRFLANMSHEIRTPMNGVLGMTDLLLETKLDPEQRDYAEAVKTSGDTLLQLINDILDFSKIEAGRLELEDIPFDISNCCNGVLDVLAQLAAEKKLELTGFVDLALPMRIKGDPSRLRQVLLNLTNNAVKFTSSGEVALRVLPVGTDRLRFEVEDTGIGIPADRVAHLFKAFSQVDASTTRQFGGTGLGLAISRELVELMGGRLSVESTEGKGSRFWFDLPLRPAVDKDLPVAMANLDALRELRILVADDVEASREILQRYCEAWGCRVDAVASAATATSAVEAALERARPYDVVLLDNGLPNTSGLSVGRGWRERTPSLSSALILLTSYAERGDARRAHEAGFAGYLTKPVKMDTLRDVLRTVVGGETTSGARTLITRHTVSENRRRQTRILVAEDNIVNQKVALRMLERLGYEPTLVPDGQAAVEQFAAAPYDIVLMDCQMPRMDGYQATGAIRGLSDAGARVPIVAMTANAMVGDREKCLDAGMTHYLTKPISARALSAVLEEALETLPP